MGTLAIATGIIGAISGGISAYNSYESGKQAKAQAKAQNEIIKQNQKVALDKRKTMIDEQRENYLAGIGESTTSFTGSSGVKGSLSNWSNNLNKLG